jgi:lipopolysaccharide/colanic/teichoic acid biosynthesis glycosyltransferase
MPQSARLAKATFVCRRSTPDWPGWIQYARDPLVVRERLFYEAVKRLFDISISFAAVLAALPLLILVAVAVKLTSPGPVFFYHRRLGKNGEEFDCPKFRTMVSDAEAMLTSDPGLRKQFSENYQDP